MSRSRMTMLPLFRHHAKLAEQLRNLLGADTARISSPLGKTIFLIIGHKRNTKDDATGYWADENGNRRDWEYMDEKVVASGETEEELIASAQEYKRICGLTMEEYLEELWQS